VPRVKRGTKRRESRKKTLALAKGFFLTKSKLHRAAQEAVEKSLKDGYVGRKLKAGIELNRKILADLAYNDPPAFAALATQAKAALEAAHPKTEKAA
jgi:large subunit ribosomal protein L20